MSGRPRSTGWERVQGSPGYVMYERGCQPTLSRLAPLPRAVLDVATAEMNAAGHAHFGRGELLRLVSRNRRGATAGGISNALKALKKANFIDPDSRHDCVIVYPHVAQQGTGSKYCPQHGECQRTWLIGTKKPGGDPQITLPPVPPHHKYVSASVVNEATGELYDTSLEAPSGSSPR